HPQFAGMYAGAVSDPKTRQIVEGADLVLDLGGGSLNDITTAAYSPPPDPSRFITLGTRNTLRRGPEAPPTKIRWRRSTPATRRSCVSEIPSLLRPEARAWA